jgi:hypothetical protein
VDYVSQNGYILYFSDRRGMLPDPLAVPSVIKGSYGFEDVINSSSNNGTPDGQPETPVLIAHVSRSPEDVDDNGRSDKYGAANVGIGFGIGGEGTLTGRTMAARKLYYEAVRVGEELPPLTKLPVDRVQLARYAGSRSGNDHT